MIANFRIVGRGVEAISLEMLGECLRPGDMIEIRKITAMTSSIFIIYNTVTGKATTSAPTAELIERAYNHVDSYFPKRGPEQVICEFSTSIGINLTNFDMFPKSMVWPAVALYAKRKTGS